MILMLKKSSKQSSRTWQAMYNVENKLRSYVSMTTTVVVHVIFVSQDVDCKDATCSLGLFH